MTQKKLDDGGREITTPLFMLRAVQLGVSIRDLELLTAGLLIDMHTEGMNDRAEDDETGEQWARQTDFDEF